MKPKFISGIVILLVGVVLLCYGFYGTSRMQSARQDIKTATGIIPDNPFKTPVKDSLNQKVDSYQTPVTLCYVGGVVFILLGGFLVFWSMKKK